MQPTPTSSPSSRKKFLLWGGTILAALSALKFIRVTKAKSPEKKNETVKMLGRNGELVEIDKSLLVSTGKKISNEELKNWVKR